MLRIGKMTDYGIVLMTYIAKAEPGKPFSARGLAQLSSLSVPTVSKVLKTLCRGGILESSRGINGGYRLARPAEDISITQLLDTMEGTVALTECSHHSGSICDLEPICPSRNNWQKINSVVRAALGNLTLKEMTTPLEVRQGEQAGKMRPFLVGSTS